MDFGNQMDLLNGYTWAITDSVASNIGILICVVAAVALTALNGHKWGSERRKVC